MRSLPPVLLSAVLIAEARANLARRQEQLAELEEFRRDIWIKRRIIPPVMPIETPALGPPVSSE